MVYAPAGQCNAVVKYRALDRKPLAVDLFCGLGGWTEGFLAEGYDVVGFDIERRPYPAQLVLQDVLTLHGSQFRHAAIIVASPPCQAYSYRAMPWKRAKALPPPDNTLFEACFRIQREAIEASDRYIPLVVENVCGAQKWVGRAKWHFGSFYLWGDVPALMPMTRHAKVTGTGSWFYAKDNADAFCWRKNGYLPKGVRIEPLNEIDSAFCDNGPKIPTRPRNAGDTFGWRKESPLRSTSSSSSSRKAASAQIAKIPFPLARHIARVYKPASMALDSQVKGARSK